MVHFLQFLLFRIIILITIKSEQQVADLYALYDIIMELWHHMETVHHSSCQTNQFFGIWICIANEI